MQNPSDIEKSLGLMGRTIDDINHKLRVAIGQLSRLAKIAEALENESHLPSLLKIASHQFLSLCPAGSGVYFGFFDDERKSVHLYHENVEEASHPLFIENFYSSELPANFQNALKDPEKKFAHLKAGGDIPKSLAEFTAPKNQREFLLIPIRKFCELAGFILVATPTENFFSKNNVKFYSRIGHVISRAIVSAILFARSKERDAFESVLNTLSRQITEGKPIETLLDFCLGSLIELLGVERASLMRYDDEKKELKVCVAKGYKVTPISGSAIKWGEGIAGLAIKESRAVSIPKIKEMAKPNPESEIKVKSLLCLPLVEEGTPLGVVNVSTLNFYKTFGRLDLEMAEPILQRMARIVKDLP
jgi:putative methionine-R-sulfoxide reductase with GAF domain